MTNERMMQEIETLINYVQEHLHELLQAEANCDIDAANETVSNLDGFIRQYRGNAAHYNVMKRYAAK